MKTLKIEDYVAGRIAYLSTFFAEHIPAWTARRKYPRPTVGETIEILLAYFAQGEDGIRKIITEQWRALKQEYPNTESASGQAVRTGISRMLRAWSVERMKAIHFTELEEE